MRISIGMLAYNEEKVVDRTIGSLLDQSVFRRPTPDLDVQAWEIVVVPNGCKDGTAKIAEAALAKRLPSLPVAGVTSKVVDLAQPGKSNAWNRFVHELSSPDADVLVLVDADIEFDHPDTILNSLRTLKADTHAQVVVDLPRKDFERQEKKSLRQKLSLRGSKATLEGPPGISGQFYCARAAVLRGIQMPAGLPVEDGFLYGMIVTNYFREDPDPTRVIRAKDASHFFEGLYRLSDLYRHELRIVIGTALNCYFMWDFLAHETDRKGPGAGELIRRELGKDPNWYHGILEKQIRGRGYWVLPGGMFLRRFSALRGKSFVQILSRLPIAMIGFALDVPVLLSANRRIKRGQAVGFW